MKRQFLTAFLFGAFGLCVSTAPAHANNRSVESMLASYGDVSQFYAALLNTGVLAELNDATRYTIFAPTNEAFAEIRPNLYPCFYAIQCRAQLADVLRDHIVVGRYTLKELTRQPHVATLGHYPIYAESPYVGEYDVSHQRILSSAELRGNMLDRINGVIVTNEQLTQFRALPPTANAVTERTITTYTPAAYPAPGGGYDAATVTQTTVTPPQAVGVITYPDGTQVTTTRRVYIAPDGLPAGQTTVTHTTTTEQ